MEQHRRNPSDVLRNAGTAAPKPAGMRAAVIVRLATVMEVSDVRAIGVKRRA
jgi:hypothetical protein